MTANRARRDLALLTTTSTVALTLPASVAQATRHRMSKPASVEKVFVVPNTLTQSCVADSKPPQQALSAAWTPPPPLFDQWTSLVHMMACDLSGARDLGWHRIPLRTYVAALRSPLTWVEWQGTGVKAQHRTRVLQSVGQSPSRLELNVSGTLQEVWYDARQGLLSARFLRRDAVVPGTTPVLIVPSLPPGQCAGTQLQFQQQNDVWLLSGMEPVPGSPC